MSQHRIRHWHNNKYVCASLPILVCLCQHTFWVFNSILRLQVALLLYRVCSSFMTKRLMKTDNRWQCIEHSNYFLSSKKWSESANFRLNFHRFHHTSMEIDPMQMHWKRLNDSIDRQIANDGSTISDIQNSTKSAWIFVKNCNSLTR